MFSLNHVKFSNRPATNKNSVNPKAFVIVNTEAISEIKSCCEACARASFPGVMQPAPSAPPARSQYTSTRKKHSGDRRAAPLPPTAPRPSPQVAARGGVSVGGQSPRLARTPGAQHGRVLPCGHRSTAGPALSTSAARTTICRLPRQGGQPQEETRASRPPGAEGRGGLGQARAGRTAARGEGAPRPVSLTIRRLPAHPDVIVPRRRARPPPPGGSRGPCPYAPAVRAAWAAPAVRDGRAGAAPRARRGCWGILLPAGFRRFRLLPEVFASSVC